jgi:hypothetical protein
LQRGYKKKTDDILDHYVGLAEEAYRVYASAPKQTRAVKKEVIRQGLSRQSAMDGNKPLIGASEGTGADDQKSSSMYGRDGISI